MKLRKILLVCLIILLFSTSFVWATENKDIQDENNAVVAENEQVDTIENVPAVIDTPEIPSENQLTEITSDTENELLIATNPNIENDVIDNDYFDANDNLIIKDKIVYGNVFLMGESVELNNVTISGSAFIMSMDLKIENVSIDGSAYVLAKDIELNQANIKNIYSMAQSEKINDGAYFSKNLFTLAEKVFINGYIENEVGIAGKNIEIGEYANIIGKLNVTSSQDPKISENAKIGDYNFIKEEVSDDVNESIKISTMLTTMATFVISAFLVTIIIIYGFKDFGKKIQNENNSLSIVQNGLWGLLFLCAIPLTVLLLLVTYFAAKFGIVLLLVYIAFLLLAIPLSCFVIGNAIANKLGKTKNSEIIIITVLVALIIAILENIPVVSFVLDVILLSLGLGYLVLIPIKRERKDVNVVKEDNNKIDENK